MYDNLSLSAIGKSPVAEDYLAATRDFLSLPADPDDRQRQLAALQQKWRVLFSKLLAAVDTSDPDVWFALGHGYSNGWGTERDTDQAAAWFHRAADAGHTDAMLHLAMHLRGPAGGHDFIASIPWLTRAASMGNASAMVHLGFAYREGNGVVTDAEEAVTWFSKAFEAGDDCAAVHAGRVTLRHLSRPKDALFWFKKAADRGCSESFIELAMMYDNTEYDFCDPAEAVKWYHVSIAASSHVPRSLLALAQHYLDGSGVPKNNGIARLLLKRILSDQPRIAAFRGRAKKLLDALEAKAVTT